MAAYKLTLVENNTGDVLFDLDVDCVIGAACDKEGTVSRMLYSACSTSVLTLANAGVRDIVKKLETENPLVALLTETAYREAEKRGAWQA